MVFALTRSKLQQTFLQLCEPTERSSKKGIIALMLYDSMIEVS